MELFFLRFFFKFQKEVSLLCQNPFDKCLYELYIIALKYILSMKVFKKLTTFSPRMCATNDWK